MGKNAVPERFIDVSTLPDAVGEPSPVPQTPPGTAWLQPGGLGVDQSRRNHYKSRRHDAARRGMIDSHA